YSTNLSFAAFCATPKNNPNNHSRPPVPKFTMLRSASSRSLSLLLRSSWFKLRAIRCASFFVLMPVCCGPADSMPFASTRTLATIQPPLALPLLVTQNRLILIDISHHFPATRRHAMRCDGYPLVCAHFFVMALVHSSERAEGAESIVLQRDIDAIECITTVVPVLETDLTQHFIRAR